MGRGLQAVVGGNSEPSAWREPAACVSSARPHTAMTTCPPGLTTRLAACKARTGSAAYWNELKPVTTSKRSSGYGSASMSPSWKSALGSRSRAIASSSGVTSKPETAAPRAAARVQARPAPQPTSSRAVPGPRRIRVKTSSYKGRTVASWTSAQCCARAPHSAAWTPAEPGFIVAPVMTCISSVSV
jgi:hypothetical protein